MISGSKITFIVGGSVAAYKSAYIVSQLTKQGARVSVVMTENAKEFITPLTFQSLTSNRVRHSQFNEGEELSISHIALADSADIVVVAPATANIMAKAATGLADDLASSVLLATKAPILMAPAMNVNMWENAVTQENVASLKKRGVRFVGPESGHLACGWVGAGRLASADDILHGINYLLSAKDLRGSRVLVTCGTTREYIDNSRFLTAKTSSHLASSLARVAYLRGADVDVVSAYREVNLPHEVNKIFVDRAQEMKEGVLSLAEREVKKPGASYSGVQFIFAAAVLTPFQVVASTLSEEPSIYSSPSEGILGDLKLGSVVDMLQELGESRLRIEERSGCKLKLIGFTQGTGKEEALLRQAGERLARAKGDMIVGRFSATQGTDESVTRVWLLDKNGRQEEVATADMEYLAQRIITAASRL